MQASDSRILEQAKELVSREIKLCKTLRAMISRELEAIVLNGDMDELFMILEQKDEIISQLQLLADGWQDIIPSSIHNTTGFVPQLLELYPDDKELSGMLEESREIAQSIMMAEDDAKNELDKFTSELRSKMAMRAHGRNAAASYAKMGGSVF